MRGSVGMNNKMKFLCVPVLLVHAAGFQIVDHFEDYDPFWGGQAAPPKIMRRSTREIASVFQVVDHFEDYYPFVGES